MPHDDPIKRILQLSGANLNYFITHESFEPTTLSPDNLHWVVLVSKLTLLAARGILKEDPLYNTMPENIKNRMEAETSMMVIEGTKESCIRSWNVMISEMPNQER